MAGYLERMISNKVLQSIDDYPIVALLGPRQVGKSTLAKHLISNHIDQWLYLDLEKPSDLRKLSDPEFFLDQNKSTFLCFDEIQRLPEIFPLLRSVIDERNQNKQFLVLGSASRDLLNQSSESLAGRIAYVEISPFTLLELRPRDFTKLWLRGGFPKSFLSPSDHTSADWRENYIRTFLERDIPQLGFNIPAQSMRRLWRILAHCHGQTLNSSKIASALGVSSHTVNSYIDILEQTFIIRLLRPFETNTKKKYIKSPKVYIRDSGLLHSLLEIESMNELFGHPIYGSSFEGYIIENIISHFPRWRFYFYRTKSGAEVDLIMEKGQRRLVIEIKSSKAPKLERGFWSASEDINATEKYLISPVDEPYLLKGGVKVIGLFDFLQSFNG